MSNVRYMRHMFYNTSVDNASSFNQPLNNWNVSGVRDMRNMFAEAISFNQPLNKWSVSNVEDMRLMFENTISFNQPLHAPWYMSNVE